MPPSRSASSARSSTTTQRSHADPHADLEKQDDDEPGLPPPDTTPRPTDDGDDELAAFRVDWEDGEPANPFNFGRYYKAWITFQLGMLALAGSATSSIIAPAEPAIAQEFGVSLEVTVLCIALYVLGFAFGPSLWAPISETYGRKVSILPAMFVVALFSIGSATSRTPAALFITRFFGGVFGSAPISNVSAALGDMYAPAVRGVAVTFYAVAVVGGPTLAPTIGAALNVHYGWRWTEYLAAIWIFAFFLLSAFCLPETYAPVLLKRKAKRLRKETGDQRWWHPHEKERINLNNVVSKHLSRPLRMLFTEPMVTAIAIYASFVYGLLYMTLEVFPIVFSEIRGWGPVVSTLPFLALFVGVWISLIINLGNQPRYIRLVQANGGKAVPEARLPPMIIGGVLFVIGLFWFGWTAEPEYHWALPVVAIGFIGAGFNIIFQQCINFLVDSYKVYAASAVSGNTVLRSVLACGLPLAARPMFHNLGVGPAASILGAFACLALPVPFLFMKYGESLRRRSKFA